MKLEVANIVLSPVVTAIYNILKWPLVRRERWCRPAIAWSFIICPEPNSIFWASFKALPAILLDFVLHSMYAILVGVKARGPFGSCLCEEVSATCPWLSVVRWRCWFQVGSPGWVVSCTAVEFVENKAKSYAATPDGEQMKPYDLYIMLENSQEEQRCPNKNRIMQKK